MRGEKILIFSKIADRYYTAIKKKNENIELYTATSGKDLPLNPVEVTILLAWIIKSELLGSMKSLKWIHSLGAGVDGFFQQPALLEGKVLTRSIANLPRLIAQYSIAAVLSDNIGYEKHSANQKRKVWEWEPFIDIDRKTAVVIGTGAIGTEIARTMKFFKLRVIGVNRSGRSVSGFDETCSIDRLEFVIGYGDYVIIAVPLTAETRGLIDLNIIKKMKKDALLINIARGAVINEKDLIHSLDEGIPRRAVLDVFDKEPLPADSPFWMHPRVTVTPHIAGVSDVGLVAEEFLTNYGLFIADKSLNNIVDVSRGY